MSAEYSVEEVLESARKAAALSEALNALEDAAVNGHKLLGDDALRFRALVDRIAPTAEPVAQGEADELIDAYDDAVRSERESGFLPPLAQKAARDCVSHNRSRLRKALAAQPRAVPDGMVLVPREPTVTMLDAALKLQGDDAFLARAPAVLSAFVKIYKAMLAAAGVPSHDA